MTFDSLALQGKTRIPRSLAAVMEDKLTELRKTTIRESFSNMRNTPHRLEFVANIHGIEFLNDSRASSLNSTWFALESMNKPLIWIAGGSGNKEDFIGLAELIKKKVKAIICIGDDRKEFSDFLRNMARNVYEAETLQEAVESAYDLGQKGDVVLFSPGCPSFDMFKDFVERGETYRRMVKSL
ncbi:MAG: hypothetical protein FJY10_03335 [Bacteroidetes bacterium]|nr:hypothetical protein [Bacteroidota bacterium]